jgi:hypothetical protein
MNFCGRQENTHSAQIHFRICDLPEMHSEQTLGKLLCERLHPTFSTISTLVGRSLRGTGRQAIYTLGCLPASERRGGGKPPRFSLKHYTREPSADIQQLILKRCNPRVLVRLLHLLVVKVLARKIGETQLA